MVSRFFGPPVQWSAGAESQRICEPRGHETREIAGLGSTSRLATLPAAKSTTSFAARGHLSPKMEVVAPQFLLLYRFREASGGKLGTQANFVRFVHIVVVIHARAHMENLTEPSVS